MSSFTLYEVTSHNDIEIHKEHTVEELLYLNNPKSLILSNWFYRLHGHGLENSIMEFYHYIQIDGGDLLDIIECLDLVLNEEDIMKRDMLALHYFPIVYVISNYVSQVGMFSDEYYKNLKDLYNDLKKILPSSSVNNRERLFLYKIG
jgi:hypothetical protein